MIYLVYDYFFPAYKAGGPIQSLLNLASQLQDEIPMKVICSNRDHDGTVLNVEPNQWSSSEGTSVYYTTKGFEGIKEAIANDVSVAFINGIYSFQFNFLPALKMRCRKIISVRGMLHPGALSQKRIKKQVYLKLWKLLGLHRKCEYHATSEDEKKYIRAKFGNRAKVWVVPNLPKVIPFHNERIKEAGSLVLCTIALVSPMKNHLEVLKALRNCSDTIIYNIYGPIKNTEYWNRCKEVINTMPGNITINYHGGILPSAVSEVLYRSDVFMQPSKSENFGHSIFEAFTSGVPVITSHNTPWNRLAACKAGCNVSDNNETEMSNAISFFASMNEDEFASWRVAARNYAMEQVNIQSIKDQYMQMFRATPSPSTEAF